jgi:hypothetical protein
MMLVCFLVDVRLDEQNDPNPMMTKLFDMFDTEGSFSLMN